MNKKNKRCDVHVLTMQKNKQYWDQCFASLEDEPVNVHRMEGIEGNVGKGRFKGYGLGTAEYVSYVDDDDYVLPGAYATCMQYLDDHPNIAAVSTCEQVIENEDTGLIRTTRVQSPATWTEIIPDRTIPFHHIFVARRAVVNKYRAQIVEFPSACDRALSALMLGNGYAITQLETVGYVWRKFTNGMHTKFNKDRSKMAALRRQLRGR